MRETVPSEPAMLRGASTCCLLVALSACSGGGVIDTSIEDVGVDAGHDAGIDAALDVGLDAQDVGHGADGGPDPGWVRLAGFPDDCFVERASSPQSVLAFHWDSCGGGLAGCQMAAVGWSIEPLNDIVGMNGGNASALAFLVQLVSVDRSHNILAVVYEDRVVAAWRSRYVVDHGMNLCGAAPMASRDGLALAAQQFSAAGVLTDHVGVASWSDLAPLEGPLWASTAATIPPGDLIQGPSTTATTYAGTLLSGDILAIEPPIAAVVGNGALYPIVVGRSVLWTQTDAAGTTSIHVSRLGGTDTVLYSAPTGSDLIGVRSDGAWIVWRGLVGTTIPFNELWVAPYRESAPLAARRLWTDLTMEGLNGTIGDGMFVHLGSDASTGGTVLNVVDLSDGSRRQYTLPPPTLTGGWAITTDAAWVTRDEVAIPAITRTPSGTRLPTVVRIDLRGLPVEPLP